MKIVIDIDEKDYKRIKEIPEVFNSLTSRAYKAIRNGTPLPEHHGRLADVDEIIDYFHENVFIEDTDPSSMFFYKDVPASIVAQAIKDAPTIIEADRGGSE